MTKLNDKAIYRVASVLLEKAADEFSNHGCNDMDDELINSFELSDVEKDDFVDRYKVWNGDDEYPKEFGWLMDSGLMSFVAAELKKMAQEAE